MSHPSDSKPDFWGRTFPLILLGVLVVLGILARTYRLGEKSLWSDEIATIATSRGNAIDPDAFRLSGRVFDPPRPATAGDYREKAVRLPENPSPERVANVLKGNVHPPLFFCLMALWMSFFSPEHAISPVILRLPSVIAACLSIPMLYLLARTLQAQCFALLGTMFFTLSAYQIDHAQDARPYTLLLLLAMLAAWLVVGPLAKPQPKRRAWVALSLTLAAGLYTQYFFALFAGFILSYLFLRITWLPKHAEGEAQRRSLRHWGYCIGGIVLLFAPWAPFFSAQTEFFRQAGHYTAGLWNPVHLPEKLWRILCGFFMPVHSWGKILPLLIIPLSLIAWLAFRALRNAQGGNGRASRQCLAPLMSGMSVFLLLWLFTPLLGQLVLDLLKHTHTATIRRYLFLLSPACYLLMSHALTGFGRWIKKPWGALIGVGFTAAILTFMLQDTISMLFDRHVASDEFRQAARRINHFYRPGDLVLVNKSGAMAVGMAYYLHPDILMLGLDTPKPGLLREGSPLSDKVDQAIAGKHRVWLVFSHSAPSTERYLIRQMQARGFRWEGWRKYPGVKVIQWLKTSSNSTKTRKNTAL